MTKNPPWFDALRSLAGDGYAVAAPAFLRAAALQERFLADLERLTTAPGVKADEVRAIAEKLGVEVSV